MHSLRSYYPVNNFPDGKLGCQAFSYQCFDSLHELLVAVCDFRDVVEFIRHVD